MVDVFFEGQLVFLEPATDSDSQVLLAEEDGCLEFHMPANLVAGLQDGQHVDNTPAGDEIRRLLAS